MSYYELRKILPVTNSLQVRADNQWPVVGAKMGLPSATPPEGGPARTEPMVAELLSKIFDQFLSQIEKIWFQYSRAQMQGGALKAGNQMPPQPPNPHAQPPTQPPAGPNMMSPQYRVSLPDLLRNLHMIADVTHRRH